MVKYLLLLIFLIGCGAKNKTTVRTASDLEIKTQSKIDSTGSKDVAVKKDIEERRTEVTKKQEDSIGDEYEIDISRRVDAPPSNGKTQTIKTPKGNYEIPENYDLRIKGKSSQTSKTTNGQKTIDTKKKVDSTAQEAGNVSRETSAQAKKSESGRTSDSEKKEPVGFNIGFWIFLFVILVAIVVYLKIKKII